MKLERQQKTSQRLRQSLKGAGISIIILILFFPITLQQVLVTFDGLAQSGLSLKIEGGKEEGGTTNTPNLEKGKGRRTTNSSNTNGSSSANRVGYPDVTVAGNVYISSGTIVSNEGSWFINAAATTENNGTLYLKGDFMNDGTFVGGTGKTVFWGSDAAIIGGSIASTIYNVDVNNTGGVTLQNDVSISNNLNLINGAVNLNSRRLTITNPATTGISYSSGYLISENTANTSKVQWNIGTTGGDHVIPFGTTGGTLIPLTLTVTSGNIGNITASTFPTNSFNLPYPITPDSVGHLRNISGADNFPNTVKRFWQLDKSGIDGIITAVFTYANAEVPQNGEASLRAQRYAIINSGWDVAVPGQSSSAAANTVTAPGISTFGPYTLALSTNPLPVSLIRFDAIMNSVGFVDLDWATASELNNDYFTIERSLDFNNIESIERIPGQGTTHEMHTYHTQDKSPLSGISYYRLRQTDYDGTTTFSNWKSVNNTQEAKDALVIQKVFPNPFTDEFNVTYEVPVEGDIQFELINSTGQLIFTDRNHAYQGTNMYTFKNDIQLNLGTYYLKITYNEEVSTVKLIKNR